mmetsp:Transcript_16870/g.12059  ORF Transcript_16870/g.12059 Transcript_16870/m.12059 type:complete len:95 (-) Transcript_16870:142-426(-)
MNDLNAGKLKLKYTDDLDEEDFNPSATFCKVYYEKPNEATDTLNLARTLFDLREYRKCLHFLKPFANAKHQSCLFLYCYCLYLVSEQAKEEEML